jgi:hypothetical protein
MAMPFTSMSHDPDISRSQVSLSGIGGTPVFLIIASVISRTVIYITPQKLEKGCISEE